MCVIVEKKKNSLDKHLKYLRKELDSCSDVSFEVVSLIVKIRRELEVASNFERFIYLLQTELEVIVEELNTRWLVSILDTLADHAASPLRENSLIISCFINMTKLGTTYQRLSGGVLLEESVANQKCPPEGIWDGVSEFYVMNGDMVKNLILRIDRAISSNDLTNVIWDKIKVNLRESNNMISDLSSHHKNKLF